MDRVILMIVMIVTALIPIVILINKKFKAKLLMFLPSIIMICISAILFIVGKYFSLPMQDLGMYIMSMIALIVGIILAVVALLIKLKK